MLSKFTTSLVLSCVLLSPSVFAANDKNWFEVEIYVFTHSNHTQEKWPDIALPPIIDNAIDMITPLISTNISGLNSAVNGCNSEDWINRPEWCNQQLLTNSVSYPSQVPNQIEASSKRASASVSQNTILMPNKSSQFDHYIKKLTKDPGEQGLLHMTWRQKMLPRNQTLPLRIFAGKDFSGNYRVDGISIVADNNITDVDLINNFVATPPMQTKPVWQLDGTLEIYLSHYLYIETDLVLRKEGEKIVHKTNADDYSFDSISTASTDKLVTATESTFSEENGLLENQSHEIKEPFLYAIHMKQNRRVRSDEVHYFDHPEFGLLIQIRKIKQ